MARHTLIFLSLAMILSGPVLAQQPINETREVDKNATISIETLAGEVTVTGWNKREVQITGTLDEKAEELEISGGGNHLEIEEKYPDRVKEIDGSTLKIMVPHSCDVEVSCIAADVSVAEVRGELDIETVSGEVTLRGEPSEVEAETVSGNLDVDVTTDTASLTCISGNIDIKGVRRELECSVISGNIEVDAGKDMESLECETISGDVTVTGQLPRGAEWSLAVHSGDITLNLVGKVNAVFEIETFSGEIHDVFGHKAERTSKYAPGEELEFTEGDGGASVEIEAFSGDVVVRQR